MSEISVVIPAYNEERRLLTTLESVFDYLAATYKAFEIIIVDDGSHDHTAEIVSQYASSHPQVRLLSYQPNRGKGHAVKAGVMAAKGDLILFDDADGASPISELARLTAAINNGADIAIGSRAKPDESRVVKALAHRKFIGNTFNYIVQNLLLSGIYDTQCGFKLFKKAVGQQVFSLACTDGFGFDVEVLYIAKILGYNISEVAINWANVEGSKVNVLVDSPKMFLEILCVVISSWFGKYKKSPERMR